MPLYGKREVYMKFRLLTSMILLFSFILTVFAQRGKPRDLEMFIKAKNVDTDRDFKVDSSDLRYWAEAVADIYNAQRPMMRMAMPTLEYAKLFDKNNDGELSSSEERAMRDALKKALSEAFKYLLTEYDLNKNRRFDEKELPDLRAAIPNFTEYAINFNEKAQLPVADKRFGQKEPEPVKEEVKVKRKLDDIYD